MSRDIIKRFIEILAEVQPSFSECKALQIEQQLRHEFAGDQVYIQKLEKNIDALIAMRFTGDNADKIAHELHISRRTVYRALKKRRVAAR